MSIAFEPTITMSGWICHLHVEANLYNKGVGMKASLLQHYIWRRNGQKSCGPQVGLTSDFPILGNMMDSILK